MSSLVLLRRNMLKESTVNIDGSLTTQNIEWLSTEDVAQIYKLPLKSVRNMTSNGFLPVYKLGHRNRYNRIEIDQILMKSRKGR